MDTKSPLESKGVLGVVISALGLFAEHYGIEITATQLDTFVFVGMQIYGLGQALYGRWVAENPISLFKAKENPDTITIDTSKLSSTEKNALNSLLRKTS